MIQTNDMKIVSIPDIAGGTPTVEGTRLSCADVAINLEQLGLDRFCQIYSGLTIADIVESLRYCSEKQCVEKARAYCHSCSLRQDEPDGRHVWLVSADLLRRVPSRRSS